MTNLRDERGQRLRALILSARKDPAWGKPRGLTQDDVADLTGLSAVHFRNIENAYYETAPADTLGRICYKLHIDPDLVLAIQLRDVADAISARIMLNEAEIPDYVLDAPPVTAEQHLKETPGLSDAQRALLVDALHQILRMEPLGQQIWARRGVRKRRRDRDP